MILEILKKAKEKISDPANWCREMIAQKADGTAAYNKDPEACKWCAAGAIWSSHEDSGLTRDAFQFMTKMIPELQETKLQSIFEVNDVLGHEAVMNLFDLAISKLEPPAEPIVEQ
ncbi:MAG TPA: hypothetical protein VM577_08760 [Anaerovoracaceae bacterium]|nr:hypothetical protein [Anaerovoracaceae bacterium]